MNGNGRPRLDPHLVRAVAMVVIANYCDSFSPPANSRHIRNETKGKELVPRQKTLSPFAAQTGAWTCLLIIAITIFGAVMIMAAAVGINEIGESTPGWYARRAKIRYRGNEREAAPAKTAYTPAIRRRNSTRNVGPLV